VGPCGRVCSSLGLRDADRAQRSPCGRLLSGHGCRAPRHCALHRLPRSTLASHARRATLTAGHRNVGDQTSATGALPENWRERRAISLRAMRCPPSPERQDRYCATRTSTRAASPSGRKPAPGRWRPSSTATAVGRAAPNPSASIRVCSDQNPAMLPHSGGTGRCSGCRRQRRYVRSCAIMRFRTYAPFPMLSRCPGHRWASTLIPPFALRPAPIDSPSPLIARIPWIPAWLSPAIVRLCDSALPHDRRSAFAHKYGCAELRKCDFAFMRFCADAIVRFRSGAFLRECDRALVRKGEGARVRTCDRADVR